MPEYYKYLVGLFGFDPDETGVTPGRVGAMSIRHR